MSDLMHFGRSVPQCTGTTILVLRAGQFVIVVGLKVTGAVLVIK